MDNNASHCSVDPEAHNMDRREFIRLAAVLAGYLAVDHSSAAADPLGIPAFDLGNEALRVHVTSERILGQSDSIKNALGAIDMLRRLQVESDQELQAGLATLGSMSARNLSEWTSRFGEVDVRAVDAKFNRWTIAARVAVLAKADEHLGTLLQTTGYVDRVARDALRYGQQLVHSGPERVRSRLREMARDRLGNLNRTFVRALPGFDPHENQETLLLKASGVVRAFSGARENLAAWSELDDKQMYQGVRDLLTGVLNEKNKALAQKLAQGLVLADRLKLGADFKFENLKFGDAVIVGLDAARLLGVKPERLEKVGRFAGIACQVANLAGYGGGLATGGGTLIAGGFGGLGGGGPDPALTAALAEISRMLKDIIGRLQRIEDSIATLHNKLDNLEISVVECFTDVRATVVAYAEEAIKARVDSVHKKLVDAEDLAIGRTVKDEDFDDKWIAVFELINEYCNTTGIYVRLPADHLSREANRLTRVKVEAGEGMQGLLRGLDVFYQVPDYTKSTRKWNSLPGSDASDRPRSSAGHPHQPLNPSRWAVSVEEFTRMVFAVVELCTENGVTKVRPKIRKTIADMLPALKNAGEATEFLYDTTGSAKVAKEAVDRISGHLSDTANLWNPLTKEVTNVLLPNGIKKPPLLPEFSFVRAKDLPGGEAVPGSQSERWPYPRMVGRILDRSARLDSFFVSGLDKTKRKLVWGRYEKLVVNSALTEKIFTRESVGKLQVGRGQRFGVGTDRYEAHEWTREPVMLRLKDEPGIIKQDYLAMFQTCSIWHYTHALDDWYVAERGGAIVDLSTFFEEVARQYCALLRRQAVLQLRNSIEKKFFAEGFSHRFRNLVVDAAFANFALAVWVWRHGAYPYAGGTVPIPGADARADAMNATSSPVPFAIGHVGDILFSPQEFIALIAHEVAALTYSTEPNEVEKFKIGQRGSESVQRLLARIQKSVEEYEAQFAHPPKSTIPPVAIGMAQLDAVRDLLDIK